VTSPYRGCKLFGSYGPFAFPGPPTNSSVGIRSSTFGNAVGLPLALLAGRSAGAMLFGLKAYDPLTLGFAIALLTVIAILASWLPARRAANLDPVAALRSE
jgi:putative ABC transport system permease protein